MTTAGAGPTPTERMPVEAKARIGSLDALRGVAVLGILAVNAASFALPFMVYDSPALSPFPVVADNAVARWAVEVFFQQKFIALFSILFGASIYLVGGERDDTEGSRLLRRRLFWLAVIALIHGLAFWYGDVLLLYAWAGLFVSLMRSLPARLLIGLGLGLTLLLATLQAAMAIFAAHGPDALTQEFNRSQFTLDMVRQSIAAYQSGWIGALGQNLTAWLVLQGTSLTVFVFSTVPLMMLGMGLLKSGFLGGRSPPWVYLMLMALGAATLALLASLQWRELTQPNTTGGMAAALASYPILITLGYAGLVILLATRGLQWLLAPFRAAGQMAFTNYLAQTLIMTSIFYMPWGPRLFGRMDYVQLWGVVATVWALQLVWSPLWLARFRMGPLEWVWRRLTYGRRVPLRKAA
jgi:uncharacterized protein